jgi:ammonium transporter, Amt family
MTSLTDALPAMPAHGLIARVADSSTIDAGDTAWLLAASALVLLMAPGLALFYGGMVRSKSVLNMIMMTFGALAAITVIWVLVGYSLAFGDDVGGGLLGDPWQHFGLQSLMSSSADSWLTAGSPCR